MNRRGCFTIVASAAAIFVSGSLLSQVPQLTSHQGNADAGKVKFEGSGNSKFVLVDDNTVVTPLTGGAAILEQKAEGQEEAPSKLDAMSVVQKLRNIRHGHRFPRCATVSSPSVAHDLGFARLPIGVVSSDLIQAIIPPHNT